MTRGELVDVIAESISIMEGFTNPDSLAAKNNNPGNLRSWGKRPVVNGFVKFPTPEAGWFALRRQVELNVGRNLTLEQFFAGKPGVYGGYAPASDGNDPKKYARFVAKRLIQKFEVPVFITDPLEDLCSQHDSK